MPASNTIGIVAVAAFAASVEAVPPGVDNHRRPAGGPDRRPAPAADHFGRPPSGIRSRRSGLRVAGFAAGPGETPPAAWAKPFRRSAAEIADHRHCRCCARAANGQRRRAAEQRDELAALHSITSSARPSSGSGMVEAERLGGLEVDDHLNFGGLLHRQVGGLLALEYPAGIDADLTEARLEHVWPHSSIRPPAATNSRRFDRSRAPRGATASAPSCSSSGEERILSVPITSRACCQLLNQACEDAVEVAFAAARAGCRSFTPSCLRRFLQILS